MPQTLWSAIVAMGVAAGCAASNGHNDAISRVAVSDVASSTQAPVQTTASRPTTTILPVAYQVPVSSAIPEPDTRVQPAPLPNRPQSAATSDPAYAGNGPDSSGVQGVLSVEKLVADVQARNPSLQAVSAAWRAATERYPQVISLEDPMFAYMISPRGAGRDNGGGWMVEASQKVPWAGKRALRGSAASAEADAMKGDIGDTRLRLAEAAKTAFYDYYLAQRQVEVNASTHRLLKQFREIASNKYQVGQATQQDVLQADVELANLESRRTELARDEQVAIARINTLLHREADCPLPPPPAKVPLPAPLPTAEALQQTAARSRPDLYALQSRVRAEQANLDLASKDYYPDLNLVAKYDGFMPEDMRPQVGMELNVPLHNARRSAAVREASDRVAQRCAEYQDRLDQARYEVRSALSRAEQSRRVVELYDQSILPAAQRSLDSALANYTSGKLDFLGLLDAQRQLYSQREMYYQSIAEYHRRLAELERAVGEPVAKDP